MAYKHRLTLLLNVLLIVLMASWFFSHFTRVSQTVRQDQSPQARQNSLLGAERFLDSLGHQVESIHGRQILDTLPPVNDLIVIKHFFSSLAEDKETALLNWVNDGGHLVTSLDKDFDKDADSSGYRFFDRLEVHRHSDDAFNTDSESGQESFQYYQDSEKGRVEFNPGAYLHIGNRDPEFTISNSTLKDTSSKKEPYHFVQFRHGEGYITLTSDLGFLSNKAIGDLDHAWLLSLIVETNQNPNKIWLLYDLDMPSLWSLLMTHATPMVCSIVILLMLWIWMAMQRSGPLEEAIDTKRRDVLEHLNMRSQFLWQHGKHEHTLAKSQQLVIKRWHQNYPSLLKLSTEKQMEWISQHSGLSVSSTHQALLESMTESDDLITQAQGLQHLQSGLTSEYRSTQLIKPKTNRNTS